MWLSRKAASCCARKRFATHPLDREDRREDELGPQGHGPDAQAARRDAEGDGRGHDEARPGARAGEITSRLTWPRGASFILRTWDGTVCWSVRWQPRAARAVRPCACTRRREF